MIKSIKIRLKPTLEQEIVFNKSCGCSRYAYNWGLSRWIELYENNKKTNMYLIKKEFNLMKKTNKELSWLYDVSSKVTNEAFMDLDKAFTNFFKKNCKYPRFKSKKTSRLSFYVRNDSLLIKNHTIKMEKVGYVKFSNSGYNIKLLNSIDKFSDPRCFYDGKYWYLSFGYNCNEKQITNYEIQSIGIDLGIKEFAYCSNNMVFKNINKSYRVKKIEKRLKQKQRQVSRKYEFNKVGNKYVKTNNIIKLEREIKLIHRKLTNIRNNHINQTINSIIKCNPRSIVIEDLNVSGMMKNRFLSRSIMNQKFTTFRRRLTRKCEEYGIELIVANMFFPSSKTCSDCGCIKSNLKLKDRLFICEECGLVLDRDFNASKNLMKLAM